MFEECRKNGEQAFIFNVTMQNHSDYSGEWSDPAIRVPGYEDEFPDDTSPAIFEEISRRRSGYQCKWILGK